MVLSVNSLRQESLPTVHQLGPNLYAACFSLMKLGVADQMIDEAIADRRLGSGGLIIESTSGTMGKGLALMGRARGLRVQLVGDPAIDPTFKEQLELLGAEVHIVTEYLDVGGYQIPRLHKVEELLRYNPGAVWMQQYHNGANPRSYRRAAERIASCVPRIDYLVASVGSGGSISGSTRGLRSLGHDARAVAVDTHGSVLFGLSEGKRVLRGLGNSIYPRNLDHALIDVVQWVEAAAAFCATRELFTDHGIDMGPTTGAAFMVARQIAQENPEKTIVFLGPDRADRYLATVYSASWCRHNGVFVDRLPDGPYDVSHPLEAHGGWARMAWNRRPLSDFVYAKGTAA